MAIITKSLKINKARAKPVKRKKFDAIPNWIDPVLQGLSFWIGHQRAYFSDYPLLEGAITAEMCNLINSKINHKADGHLYCEVLYRNLVDEIDQTRADLVIAKTEKYLSKVNRHDLAETVSTVIEVKRGTTSREEVSKDLRRLARIKYRMPKVRAFLIIVSEGKLPNQYNWFAESKTDDVVASRKSIKIEGEDAECKVRRVCKVTSSLKPQSAFHSAIMIEVENTN